MRIAMVAGILLFASVLPGQDGYRPRLVAPTPIGPAPYGPVIVDGPTAYDSFTRTPYPVPYGPAMLVPQTVVPTPPTRLVAPPPQPRVQPARRVEEIGPETRTARRVETHGTSAPLVITVGEAFANRFVADSRVEAAPVLDVVLDANVQGWQQTTTNISLDMLDSQNGARFDIRAIGATNSDTLGQTNQATVRTFGVHQFNMAKPIYFDGTQFLVQRARGFVNPSNQTVGAWTRYDDIPIIGRIANRTAYRKAMERQPTTERIAADRVAEKLIPKFNTATNNSMISLNSKLRSQQTALKKKGLWPTRMVVSSTSSALEMSAWFENASEDVRPISDPTAARSDEVRIALHSEVLEALVADLEPGGRVFQQKDIDGMLGESPSFLKVEVPEVEEDAGAMAALVKFVVDEDQPVTIDFDKGQLVLGVRLSLRPAIGPDVGPFDVRITTKVSADTRDLVFEPAGVSVEPVDENEVAQQAVAKLIAEQAEARMPTIRLSRSAVLPATVAQGRVSSLQVVGLRLDDGWATIRIR